MHTEPRACLRACVGVERVKPLEVDAGRHHERRERMAGDAGCDPRRILACRHHARSSAEHAAPDRPRQRNAAVDHHFRAVCDHDIRRSLKLRTDQPEWQHRVEEHDARIDLTRQRVHTSTSRSRRQQQALGRTLDAEMLLGIPHARPSYAVVNTVVSSGGNRRHSS